MQKKKGPVETVYKVKDSDETKVIKTKGWQDVAHTLSSTAEELQQSSQRPSPA